MSYRFVLSGVLGLLAICGCGGCGSTGPAASRATTPAPGLTIMTTSLPTGTVGSKYSSVLAAQGGVPPYSWSIDSGALPGGLQLGATSGLVSGTPTVAGTFTPGLRVLDSAQHSASAEFRIGIAAQGSSSSPPPSPSPTALSITTTTAPTGTVGASYSFALEAQGGKPPYNWSVSSGALPSGLALNSSSGKIAGTPTQAANESVTIEVEDTAHSNASESLVFSVVAAASSGSFHAYYVDSANGNDSNNGTSESAAWKTIAKVNASSFAPGDHILFNRGDTWRDLLAISSSGTAEDPIVIDAYGSGAAPVISGADLIPQSAWTRCSSCAANVWEAKVSQQPNIVLFNGTKGSAQNSTSALTAAGDWYWNANVLYVWGSANPATSYTSPGVEAGSRELVVDLSALGYVTLQTLELTGGNGIPTNGVIYAHEKNGVAPHDLVLNNLTVANGAGHGIHLEDCNNCQVQGATVSSMDSDGISLVSLDAGQPIKSGSITGNTVTGSHHDGIATYGCAIGGNCQGIDLPDGVFISGVTISGNVVHDNGEGIYLEWTNGSTVSENTTYHNTDTTNPAAEGGGVELEASSSNTIEKNLIYSNRGNGMELSNDAGAGTKLTGASNNTVRYNAVHDNGATALFTNAAPTQNNQFLYNLAWNHVNGECFLANGVGHLFAGNVCWNSSTGIDLYTSSSTPLTANITIENNIIANGITRAVHVESGVSASTLVFDHNDYDFGNGEEFLLFDTAYNLAEWQSAAGMDQHSFVANPQFVSSSPSAPGDFAVESSSPAVGKGATLSSSQAVGLAAGSSWPSNVQTANEPSAWDVGAFVVP